MTRRFTLGVLALWAMVALPHAEGPMLTMQSTIKSSDSRGSLLAGSMELVMVNASQTTLRNVTLRLASPVSGALGTGIVELGTVDVDATIAPTVDFEMEKSFLDSNEPMVVTVTYTDSADEQHEVNVVVRRTISGGAN